jgi:hypothetical protein
MLELIVVFICGCVVGGCFGAVVIAAVTAGREIEQ